MYMLKSSVSHFHSQHDHRGTGVPGIPLGIYFSSQEIHAVFKAKTLHLSKQPTHTFKTNSRPQILGSLTHALTSVLFTDVMAIEQALMLLQTKSKHPVLQTYQ